MMLLCGRDHIVDRSKQEKLKETKRKEEKKSKKKKKKLTNKQTKQSSNAGDVMNLFYLANHAICLMNKLKLVSIAGKRKEELEKQNKETNKENKNDKINNP